MNTKNKLSFPDLVSERSTLMPQKLKYPCKITGLVPHLHGASVVVSGESVEGSGGGVVGRSGGGWGLLLPRTFSSLPWIHHKHIVILIGAVTVLL